MVLHPMTFDEFMGATGHALMLEGIREAYFDRRAYQLHDQAMDLTRQEEPTCYYIPLSCNIHINSEVEITEKFIRL